MIKIMHDQDIRDELLEEVGEEAAEEFIDCLSIFDGPFQQTIEPPELHQKMVDRVNETLKKIGSAMRILGMEGLNDEGYFWEVSE
jgi:hypothetical protein